MLPGMLTGLRPRPDDASVCRPFDKAWKTLLTEGIESRLWVAP
jgi:hypothetical protein